MLTLPPSSSLLRTAEAILLQERYNIRQVDLGDDAGQFLLAENEFFIVGVVATSSLPDLLRVHPLASKRLLELIDASDLGAKNGMSILYSLPRRLCQQIALLTDP
jgi:hypothetical protein